MRILRSRVSRAPSLFRCLPSPLVRAAVLCACATAAGTAFAVSDKNIAVTPVLPVNERAIDADAAPKLVVAPDGDFVVVYRGTDIDGAGIFGRAYRADGTPLPRGEFRISEARKGDQLLLDVAADAQGNFVVAWDSLVPGDATGPGGDVYVRAFDKAGQPRSASETRVNRITGLEQDFAYLAVAATGDFVLVWTGDTPEHDGRNVYCRAFDADGTPKPGGQRAIGSSGTGYDVPFGVGVDARGDFVVGWIDFDDVESYGAVFTRAFFADGSPKPSGAQRAGGDRPGYHFSGQLDVNANGDFVVAWQNSVGPRAFARAYSPDGLPKRPNERRLSAVETRHEVDPRIAIDEQGGFVAAWQTDGLDGNDTEIYARAFDATGAPAQAQEHVVNTTTSGVQDLLHVERLARGGLAMAWTTASSEDPGDEGAYVRVYDAAGDPKPTGEQRVAAFPATMEAASAPSSILPSPSGGFVVVLGGGDARFRAFDAQGLARGRTQRADTADEAVTSPPAAAFDRDGDLVFAWATSNVNARRFSGTHPVDLAIAARDLDEPVLADEPFRYVFTVSNQHPLSDDAQVGLADGVLVSAELPGGAPLLHVEAPGWDCRTRGQRLNCTLGHPLRPADSSSIVVRLRAPQATGAVAASATVTGQQFDPDEEARGSNNQVREVTPIASP